MNKRRLVWLICAFSLSSVLTWGQAPPPPRPQIYISTLDGNQVQSVDPTNGNTTTIYSDSTSEGSNFLPEGITLGQDGKLYVAVTQNNRIVRMNQDGSQFETVYDRAACDCSGPASPEGPVIDAAGNLFFNTASGHTGVWEIAGVTSIPFGGSLPATPTNVVTATQTGSTFGEGLAFGGTFPDPPAVAGILTSPGRTRIKRRSADSVFQSVFPTIGGPLALAGPLRGLPIPPAAAPALPAGDPNLLIVDNSNNRIRIWNGSSVITLISASQSGSCSPTCIDNPIGIAVAPAANAAGNIAAGDIFVANAGTTKNVNQFDTNGSFKGTFVNGLVPNCDCGANSPIFLAIDPLGNVFVTTASDSSTGATGNVWEVTSTLVGEIVNVTATDLTQNGNDTVFAFGITLAEISLPLNSGGGTNIYRFGKTVFKFQYPPDSSFANETVTVVAIPTSQAQLNAQTVGGPFANAQIIVFDGADGNDLTFVTVCQTSSGLPCPPPPDTITYEVFISYDSVPPGAIPSNPIFLKKPDDAPIYNSSPPLPAGNGNILDNFYIMRIDPTGSGTTSCRSGSRCFHDFILANLPPDPNGPVAATFNGFLRPLAPGNRRVFNCGDTVPVEFTLTGLSSSFDPAQVVARISVERGSTPQRTHNANSQGNASSNLFLRFGGTFQYELSLDGYPPGNYTIIVTSNSFPTQTVTFSISSGSCGPGQQ